MKVYCCDCAGAFECEPGTDVRCPHCRAYDNKPEKPNSDSPEAWRVECERAVFHANVLLRLAKVPGGVASAIAEMIRTAPHSAKEADDVSVTALFGRIVLEAHRLSQNDALFRSAVEYFGTHLMAMAPERRKLLEASVTGTMMGLVMG
jgi:hypothetical protein